MIKFNLPSIMRQKGINDPHRYLIDAGINRLTVKMLLSGTNTRIDYATLEKLCLALDCAPGDLLKLQQKS